MSTMTVKDPLQFYAYLLLRAARKKGCGPNIFEVSLTEQPGLASPVIVSSLVPTEAGSLCRLTAGFNVSVVISASRCGLPRNSDQEKLGDFVAFGGGGAPPSGEPEGLMRPCAANWLRTFSRTPR